MKTIDNKTVSAVLKAVPLAMGIAVVVLSILGELAIDSAIVMLGIGMACLSFVQLNSSKE